MTDLRRIQSPTGKNLLQLLLPSLVNDDQHSLLGLGKKCLVRSHACFPLRNLVQLDLDARPAPAGRLAGGTGQPGRTHVLHTHHQIRPCVQFETGLKKKFPDKRITYLHRGTVRLTFFREIP